MPHTPSPLRYPGGKTQIYPFVKDILFMNGLIGCTYVEPFAGGAGLALKLLLNNDVESIVINDYDSAIYAIWHCILYETQKFCDAIENAILSIDEWYLQKDKFIKSSNIFELGFSAFFLNRTNLSGIIKGGVIGGKKQLGNFKIDARFNKNGLIKRVQKIADRRDSIVISNLNALDMIKSFNFNNDKTFVNFDPPYVKKGKQLYKNSFTDNEHCELSTLIQSCKLPWIVTYDKCDLVNNLYRDYRRSNLGITYSIGSTKNANEYIIFSNYLKLPSTIEFLS